MERHFLICYYVENNIGNMTCTISLDNEKFNVNKLKEIILKEHKKDELLHKPEDCVILNIIDLDKLNLIGESNEKNL